MSEQTPETTQPEVPATTDTPPDVAPTTTTEEAPQAVTPPVPADTGPAPAFVQMAVMAQQTARGESFWLVTIPDDGPPEICRYDLLSDLIAELQRLEGTETFVFAFLGQHLPLTATIPRYLHTAAGFIQVTPDGRRQDAPKVLDGYLGTTPAAEIPTTITGERGGSTEALPGDSEFQVFGGDGEQRRTSDSSD